MDILCNCKTPGSPPATKHWPNSLGLAHPDLCPLSRGLGLAAGWELPLHPGLLAFPLWAPSPSAHLAWSNRRTATWGPWGPAGEVRLAIYGLWNQLPPNTRSIKAIFSLESCSLVEPSSRQASSSPSGAHRVHRAGEGGRAAAEASWEGALSIRNDKWVSSAPGLCPGTFLRAEALRDPRG